MTSGLTSNLFYDNGYGEKPLFDLNELRSKFYDIFVYKEGTPKPYCMSVSTGLLGEELTKIQKEPRIKKIVLTDFKELPKSLETAASLADLTIEKVFELKEVTA